MTILLWILGLIAGLLLLVVGVPLTLRAEGGVYADDLDGWARLDWAWGALAAEAHTSHGLRLRLLGLWLRLRLPKGSPEKKAKKREAKRAKKKAKREAKKAKKAEKRDNERARPGPRWWWAHRGVFAEILQRAARALGLRADLDVVYGADDPAQTAWVAGWLDVLLRVIPINARVELDWLEPRLEFEGRFQVRLWGLALLGFGLGLLLDGQIRRTLLAARGVKETKQTARVTREVEV